MIYNGQSIFFTKHICGSHLKPIGKVVALISLTNIITEFQTQTLESSHFFH